MQNKFKKIFDTDYYAYTLKEKAIRSIQLFPKYYFNDIPKYFRLRKSAQLNFCDYKALFNPFRELVRKEYHTFETPAYFHETVIQLGDAGITFTLPYIRLKSLACLWWRTVKSKGDVIEFGAYKGATSLFLAKIAELNKISQKVIMVDSFEGIPFSSMYDFNRKKDEFRPALNQTEIIIKYAKTLNILDRIDIRKGRFSDSIKILEKENHSYSFAHIDANIFSGTYEACEYVIPNIVKNGGIVFDDYNGLCDLGARLAIDIYLKNKIRPIPLCSSSAYLIL